MVKTSSSRSFGFKTWYSRSKPIWKKNSQEKLSVCHQSYPGVQQKQTPSYPGTGLCSQLLCIQAAQHQGLPRGQSFMCITNLEAALQRGKAEGKRERDSISRAVTHHSACSSCCWRWGIRHRADMRRRGRVGVYIARRWCGRGRMESTAAEFIGRREAPFFKEKGGSL